jgi:hypothetical protein
VDEQGGISPGTYGMSYVLEGATWPIIDTGLPAQVGQWVLNPNPNHIEPTERVSGGHIVATYNYLGDPKQPAKLVLFSYADSQNAAEAMETLAAELDSDYVSQQIKTIGIEFLAWTRPEPKSTGSDTGYYLLFDKRIGDKDENAAGAIWVSQNVVWRLHVEPIEPGDERQLEELVDRIMAAVSSGSV